MQYKKEAGVDGTANVHENANQRCLYYNFSPNSDECMIKSCPLKIWLTLGLAHSTPPSGWRGQCLQNACMETWGDTGSYKCTPTYLHPRPHFHTFLTGFSPQRRNLHSPVAKVTNWGQRYQIASQIVWESRQRWFNIHEDTQIGLGRLG